MKKYLFLFVIYLVTVSSAYALPRIAVLPFTNMDGNAKYNVWCYNLQDSLAKALVEADQGGKLYSLVPMDSVEMVMAELNLDPGSPQYLSDLWLAVEKLNVEQVVTGNFKIQANRFLINAYIYNVATKLPNHEHQARDIFKKEEKVYEAVPIIVRNLIKAYKSE